MLKPHIKRLLKQQKKRWYELKPVPEQIALVKSKARFIVIPAGRRSGKTERAKRRIIKECGRNPNSLYFVAAPTYNQVKKIYWKDLKNLALSSILEKKPSETDLIIYFNNGTELHLIGLDKPDRMEGPSWNGGLVDECATVKKDAIQSSILPALETEDPTKPNIKAWCWFLGRPKGRNHFFKMYRYALESGDPEWAAFHWKSSVVLSEQAILAAKRRMPPKLYRQEFEASFETDSGLIYEDYSIDNITDVTIQPHEQIIYFCDFNYTPMSHGLAVIRDLACDIKTKKIIPGIYICDEIILTSAVAEQSATEFCEKYKDHKNKSLLLYGDHNGKDGEKHGHKSDYSNMEAVFKKYGWKVDRRVTPNPPIKDRQNSVRAKIKNTLGEVTLFVNPVTAPWINDALSTVVLKEGSSFLEDDKDPYQHITTAIGYFIYKEWPIDDGSPEIIWTMHGDVECYDDDNDLEDYYNGY